MSLLLQASLGYIHLQMTSSTSAMRMPPSLTTASSARIIAQARYTLNTIDPTIAQDLNLLIPLKQTQWLDDHL